MSVSRTTLSQAIDSTQQCRTTQIIKQYITLTKPRVLILMILTSIIGMQLSIDNTSSVPLSVLLLANIGIALSSASAAVINHCVDQQIDKKMHRTKKRPIASGNINTKNALIFALVLGVLGLGILFFYINTLTAVLTFLTLLGYAVFYTMFLKKASPQNIVIGGAAGAAPPLLGWVAVTNQVDAGALLLMLIIFVWTPPHFWALAINKVDEYKKADIPMLPVTHGIKFTQLNILLYSILLYIVTILPCLIQMSGLVYFLIANVLNIIQIVYCLKLYNLKKSTDLGYLKTLSLKIFNYSIIYLMLLFAGLLLDHYYLIII